jgi:hypothetical protein
MQEDENWLLVTECQEVSPLKASRCTRLACKEELDRMLSAMGGVYL